ncbi:hypothetical protein QUF79_00125 [Fictibacillus enclensis]|uniref:hypothetical protein n=1 Tax=Fictibacillus enclensis TaxID=1017270 RepID=UPI0025A211A7|nr:hypothetical protein [Fictibacillus enclensis]MDM5196507.1 hypothetical protein [Fictibacillus enclensis]
MLKKDRVNLKRNSSVFFMGFLAISMLGFMFFLSSNFLMKEKIPILNTALAKEESVSGNGLITIDSWVYDEKKNEMEVTLITKDLKTIDEDIRFEAFQRNGETSNIEARKVFEEDGIYVLKLFGLSKEFQQVALDVIKVSQNEFANEKETKEENQENKEILSTLYSDQRKVKHQSIKVKTNDEYAMYLADVLIAQTEKEMEEAENLERKEQKKQNELENAIASNQDEMIYETAEEKAETESIINGYKMKIEDSKQLVADLNAKKEILKDKKEKLELRKRELDLSI